MEILVKDGVPIGHDEDGDRVQDVFIRATKLGGGIGAAFRIKGKF